MVGGAHDRVGCCRIGCEELRETKRLGELPLLRASLRRYSDHAARMNAVQSIGVDRLRTHIGLQSGPCQYRICVERLLRERQCSRQLRVLIGLLSPSNPKLTSGSEHRSCRLHQRARVHAAHGHTRKHAQTHAHARMHNSLLEKTQAPPNRNQCSERISPTLPQDQSQQ